MVGSSRLAGQSVAEGGQMPLAVLTLQGHISNPFVLPVFP